MQNDGLTLQTVVLHWNIERRRNNCTVLIRPDKSAVNIDSDHFYFRFHIVIISFNASLIHYQKYRVTLHGLPNATQFSGIECVTTLPAPITLFFPIVTPGRMITPPPIHTLSSIVTGLAKVRKNDVPLFFQSDTNRSCGNTGWPEV